MFIIVRRNYLTIALALSPLSCAGPTNRATTVPSSSAPIKTQWRVEPSFKYDALCLLNTLTGDPFYLTYYKSVHAKFAPTLTPDAKTALAHLKHVIKDDGGGIISANLCLLFSTVDAVSLDELLATVDHPETLQTNFAKTVYWDEEVWSRFESIRPDLRTIFSWYKQTGFDKYWQENARPKAQKLAQAMLDRVHGFDVVPLIEQHLGHALESPTITVYMLNYSQPHGIKISGTRFLTDVTWPYEIVVRNSVHEMMHPPFKLEGDADLADLMKSLRADPYLMNKVENHNPSFGYNSLEGFVDEDCVQALDQTINERLGVASNARKRWKVSDDGMHVFAVALYQIMKEEHYPSKDGTFRDFLVRLNKDGRFKPGNIERYHQVLIGK